MGGSSFARRNVAALTVYAAFRGFAVGGYQALYSAYMRALGYSMAGIGGAVTASSLVAALLAPGFGAVIECLGAKPTTTLTGLLSLLSILLLASPNPSYTSFAASYLLFMLAFALGQPARSTLLARSVRVGEQGYYFAVTMVAFSATRTVGPLVAGWIASKSYPQAFQAMLASVAAGLVFFHLAAVEPGGPRGCRLTSPGILDAYRRALKPNPSLATLYTLLVIDRSGWSLWFPLLSAHLKTLGYTEEEIGLLYTISSLTQTLASIPLGRAVDRLGAARIIAVSEAAGALAALLLPEATSKPLAATAFTLMGLSIAAWVPAYNKLVAILAAGNLGEAYSNANAVRSIAGTPSPIAGGVLYQKIAPPAPFTISAALLAAAAAYALAKLQKQTQSQAP